MQNFERHLATLDQHIAELNLRIETQRALIAEKARVGFGTEGSENLLTIFLATLNTLLAHRQTTVSLLVLARRR
jgi:hypothetical protein